MSVRQIYNIPAGVPFAKVLAQGLSQQAEAQNIPLPHFRILLPTRRACRTLRDSFLQIRDGKPLLLPRMQPLGDVEEDELSLSTYAEDAAQAYLGLPPAISPLRRRILLARIIMQMPDYTRGAAQDFALAGALGRLMDQVYTEGLDFRDLPGLVEAEDLAAHWQVTVKFLEILSIRWPEILQEQGVIDAADRRNRLMNALCDHWLAQPPQEPVIAAGSTGSIPATARLMGVIAGLPYGVVVLPGLDLTMDDESWDMLDETHPQATLKQLLGRMQVLRSEVRGWPVNEVSNKQRDEPPGVTARKRAAREWLAGEMMRPAATAERWQRLRLDDERRSVLSESLKQVMRFSCDTAQEEAQLIAVMMRHTLETPEHTVALITPDRTLARRVAAICRRWDIEVDDSGGQPLAGTAIGSFLRLSMQVALEGFRPGLLATLLKHKACHVGFDTKERDRLAGVLETDLLRGAQAGSGFAALYRRAQAIGEEKKAAPDLSLLQALEQAYAPLVGLLAEENVAFQVLLDAHICLIEALAQRPDMSGAEDLWRGDDGEAAALFLSDLRDQADVLPEMDGENYLSILEQLMRTINVRPSYGTHPRVYIYGQLEARLIDADLLILGSLNEKSWPPDAGSDPWMSRPMRRDFNLPAPERSIGLAAHDFVQGFCAPHVVLTRSARMDGAPSVPARWLQRLDTVLKALEISHGKNDFGLWQYWAASLDKPRDGVFPVMRPTPAPPVDKRPDTLFVTAIERWMRDPYSIYARYILRLRKLDELDLDADAAERGSMMHEVLDRFVQDYPAVLPEDAQARLIALGRDMLAERLEEPRLWGFWWPRFERLAHWFVDHERQWRLKARPVKTEIEGEVRLDVDGRAFTLKARADRLDDLGGGTFAVIDYKTGGSPSKKDVQSGLAPQLPLEAVILLEGGFAGLSAESVSYMGFWQMTGGAEPGVEKEVSCDPEATRQGLAKLVRTFSDPQTAYYSLPIPERAPPAAWQDYAHLARVQEWTALDEAGEEAA